MFKKLKNVRSLSLIPYKRISNKLSETNKMYGLKLPKITKNIDVLIGNFDHAIFLSIVEALFSVRPKLGRYRNFKPNFKRLHRRNNTQNVFNQGKIGARLNWLAPLSCVVVNP